MLGGDMTYPGTQEERAIEERAYRLCERLGVSRESLRHMPIHLWAVPMLEKMLDAIEKLEDYNRKGRI